MSRPKLPDRVIGIYQHGSKFRVVYVQGGERDFEDCETEEAAKAKAARLRVTMKIDQGGTIDFWIGEFEKTLPSFDAKKHLRNTLRAFFHDLRETSPLTLTKADCERAYNRMSCAAPGETAAPYAVVTHHHSLKNARRFLRWLIHRNVMRVNPCEGIKPVGTKKVGKAQLRIDEARKFLDEALARADRGGPKGDAALAAVMALLLGMRATEACNRLVRDVDDGGRILWTASKTRAGTRRLRIPDVLRDRLLARCANKAPTTRVFHAELERKKLWRMVGNICRHVGVPTVCVHGLRGTHSTIAIDEGCVPEAVARGLGHASTAVTKQHYIAPGAEEARQARATLTVIQGGR